MLADTDCCWYFLLAVRLCRHQKFYLQLQCWTSRAKMVIVMFAVILEEFLSLENISSVFKHFSSFFFRILVANSLLDFIIRNIAERNKKRYLLLFIYNCKHLFETFVRTQQQKIYNIRCEFRKVTLYLNIPLLIFIS